MPFHVGAEACGLALALALSLSLTGRGQVILEHNAQCDARRETAGLIAVPDEHATTTGERPRRELYPDVRREPPGRVCRTARRGSRGRAMVQQRTVRGTARGSGDGASSQLNVLDAYRINGQLRDL